MKRDRDPGGGIAGLLVALSITVTFTVLDIVSGASRPLTATLLLGPFVATVLATRRQTIFVSAAAATAAVLSFLWNGDASFWVQLIGQAVVVVGSAVSVVAATQRERAQMLDRRATGLSSDLAAAERRLGVALDAMAGAVMIQQPGKGIVYANQAQADAVGLATPAEVMAATPEQIAGRWDSWLEDGTPLTPDLYPSRRILTGVELRPGPLVVRGLHRTTGRELWTVVRATPVLDDDGAVLMTVSISEDITAIKRAELVQRLLARAGTALSQSFEIDVMLGALADVLTGELARWCVISVAGPGGVRRAAARGPDPELVEAVLEQQVHLPAGRGGNDGIAAVLGGGPSQLLSDIPDADPVRRADGEAQAALVQRMGLRSVLHVPIPGVGGSPAGVITLGNTRAGRVFTSGDLELAEEIGRRAGTALQTATLYDERSRVAATLQNSLLPERLPDVEGFAFAQTYRPAARDAWVGGDFYDVFRTPGGWMACVGDVAGQGAEAAALTAKARHTLRTAALLTGDPVRAVTHLNVVLAARSRLSLCTACLVLLPDGDGAAQVVCAGHPLPVRVRDGAVEEVGAWGVMIGAYGDATFSSTAVDLVPGDLLALYTDGVLDARGGDGRFGETRLLSALRDATDARDAVGRLEGALDAFQTGKQADDTAVLVVHRLPAIVPVGRLRRPASPGAPPGR